MIALRSIPVPAVRTHADLVDAISHALVAIGVTASAMRSTAGDSPDFRAIERFLSVGMNAAAELKKGVGR